MDFVLFVWKFVLKQFEDTSTQVCCVYIGLLIEVAKGSTCFLKIRWHMHHKCLRVL